MEDKFYKIKNKFPIFSHEENKNLIYFDNASTTQKPYQVIESITNFYSTINANVHRGAYPLSEKSTQIYEAVREKVSKFIGSNSEDSIVFTKSATEAINTVAYAWALKNLKDQDEILLTEIEHHSNLVPWQFVSKKTGCKLKFIQIDSEGHIDWSQVDRLINTNTKLVSVTHQSNVFGSISPINEIAEKAKIVGAKILIDAAQSISHQNINVESIGCDFLVFSGHKMFAPTGVGVLYLSPKLINDLDPFLYGGQMILDVSYTESSWNLPPLKFEAGTPNFAQVVGLGSAIDFINMIGLDSIKKYLDFLNEFSYQYLEQIEGISLYGDRTNKAPIFSFNIKGVAPYDLSKICGEMGLAIRSGHHCTQPLMDKLGVSATCRMSLHIYNSPKEIEDATKIINKAISFIN